MGYAAPPPHKRFDNRFKQPNTHRSLIRHSDLKIVGSVTWYAAISEGGDRYFEASNFSIFVEG